MTITSPTFLVVNYYGCMGNEMVKWEGEPGRNRLDDTRLPVTKEPTPSDRGGSLSQISAPSKPELGGDHRRVEEERECAPIPVAV